MRKWVKVRFGLTFQDPESIIKYVKTLGKQDPQNRQAALVLLLAWLDDRLHQILAYYSTGDDASEDTVSELENSIIYLADGWRKGVLDFSEKSLPAAEDRLQHQHHHHRLYPPSLKLQRGSKRLTANRNRRSLKRI